MDFNIRCYFVDSAWNSYNSKFVNSITITGKKMDWTIIADILRLAVLAGLGIAGIVAIMIWKKNMATRVTFVRFIIQAVAFAGIFYIFSYSTYIPLLYELLVLFGLTLFLGRFYCGWLCPMGLIMDIESAIRKALQIHHRTLPEKLNLIIHKSRYIILLFFLLLPVVLWFLNPQPIMVSPLMAQLLAGYYRPYSILLDPMIPFIVPWKGQIVIEQINFTYPYVANIITYIGTNIGEILASAFVGVTLVGGFLIRRVWCRFCPT